MKVARRGVMVWCGLALTTRLASADDVAALLSRIAAARAGLRTLRGPFTQTRRVGLLAADIRSTGSLALVRPGRLRWELEPPDPVTFWVTPEGLAYRSAHGQGRLAPTRGGLAGVLDDLEALLGGDLQALAKRWSLRVVRDGPSGVELEATPREAGPAGVRSMQLGLAADLVRPTEVVLVQGPRDGTTITFGELQVNAPIDDALMRPGL
jgi:hypothetical protein